MRTPTSSPEPSVPGGKKASKKKALVLPELPGGVNQIMGLDLSLSATGWAYYQLAEERFHSGVLKPPKGSQLDRMRWIRKRVVYCGKHSIVMIEDFAFGRGYRAHLMGGLGYLVRDAVEEAGSRFYLVTPGQLKKFVTGKGSAVKSEMILGVFKRFGIDLEGVAKAEDQADAIGLCYAGLALFGQRKATTKSQEEVLKELIKRYFSD